MTAFNHRFNPTVLREYDIRGIVGDTLKPEDAFAIGRCFGSVIAQPQGIFWPSLELRSRKAPCKEGQPSRASGSHPGQAARASS